MPSIYDDSGGDTPVHKSNNNGGGGLNDDVSGVDGGDSKVCGICDTKPPPSHDAYYAGGGINGCFDPIPLCQATLSSVDQITCGGVQSMTGGLPHDGSSLEKLFRFRPSNMSDYFTRGGSGGSMQQQQQNKEGKEEDNGRQATESMRRKERGGKAAAAALLKRTYPLSYIGEAPIGPTKCEYCAAESTMECTSNLPQEYYALFMGKRTTTTTTLCKGVDSLDKNSRCGTSNTQVVAPVVVCHRPKLFFLKKRPPFATMDGWNPITEYRINLFEPPTTMEGMDRGWGEVRGHLGDKSSSNTNTTTSSAGGGGGGGDFGYGHNNNNAAAVADANATIDKEGGRGGSKSSIETKTTVRAENKVLVITNSTNNIHDISEGGGNCSGNGGRSSSSPVQWAWSGLMGVLTPKSSKDVIK